MLAAPHVLTPAQDAAREQLLEWLSTPTAVAVLAGLAGTGKSYLVGTLLGELVEQGKNILLTAPTHQALAVVSTGLDDIESMTLHAALGLAVRENEDGTTRVTSRRAPKIRGYDLIVVDEASMVGAELYQTLMRERDCAVLFVGDPGQLPPIGETESPAFAEVTNRASLTQVVRQAEGSALIQLAHEIRSQAENGRRVALSHVRSYAQGEAQIQTGGLSTVTELAIDARSAGFNAVAITYRNEDVDRINNSVHRALFPADSAPFSPGERILFRAPYHEPGREHEEPLVRTNEFATVVELSAPRDGLFDIPSQALQVRFDDGRVRTVPIAVNPGAWKRACDNLFAEHRAAKAKAALATGAEAAHLKDRARDASARAWMLRTRFANVQHAYALTAHRAQGSTYEIVILHWQGLERMRDDFEHARAVYVAATRASEYMVIVE